MAYNGAGIYGLYNVMDHKIYVGKSVHISNRISAHKQNFKKKSDTLSMYKEPIENFVFVVLLKMSDAEYDRFGDLLETVFIHQAIEWNIPVYNCSKTQYTLTSDVLMAFGVWGNLRQAIFNATGTEYYNIRSMCKPSRKGVLRNINEKRKVVKVEID